MRYFTLLLLVLTGAGLSAQTGLRADADWFQEQGKVYQQWLDRTGLGQYLRIEEVVVETDEVNVFLNLGTTDIDAVVNRWTVLKDRFEETAGMTLEEKLFYKGRSLFQLSPEKFYGGGVR